MIGPMPPPSGGVSIHIKRLSKLIEKDFEIDYIDESRNVKVNYFNIRSYNLIQYFKKVIKADLIYIHSGTTLQRVFHIASGKIFAKKIIVTLHAYPFVKKMIQKKIDEFFFNWANLVISVNNEILNNISLNKEKCLVKHAFLPPDLEIETELPGYLKEWITKEKNIGKYIICANAIRIDIFDGLDLYGLDMCIRVAKSLNNSHSPVSFVFNVSSLEKNKDLYLKYERLIKELNLVDNFLLINEELSFVNLILESDIVVRPTATDGDALTVREALFLGKKIIASDVVSRPAETILFKSRDLHDFENKIKYAISLNSKFSYPKINEDIEEYKDFYSQFINSVMSSK